MYRGSKPRILPLIIAILVIALIIAGVVSLARLLFFNGNDAAKTEDQSKQTTTIQGELLNTESGRSVRYTVRGSIVADEKFSSYQITVSPSTRTYTAYKGYLETPTTSKSYPNSMRAYEEFVYALDKANISKTREVNNNDIRGVCATNGRLYVFETVHLDKVTQSVWTSTCSGSKGSMAANISQVHALFANQIPDFKPMFDKVQ